MDAVEFFKTMNRLCRNLGCEECPVFKEGLCMVIRIGSLGGDSAKSIEETISKVEQWAKDHPVKIRQSDFLKMFPNAPIDEDNGILCIRPCDVDESIGCTNEKGCNGCRCKYWLTEVTDNGDTTHDNGDNGND